MVKRIAALLVLLFLPALSLAQGAKVKGATHYEPHEPIILKPEGVGTTASCLWYVDGGARYVRSGNDLHVWAKPGNYLVLLTVVDFDKKLADQTSFAFTVGVPPDPKPPIPPDPKPPDPKPPDPPKPTPAGGLKVLILYDAKMKTTYTDKTLDILHGQEMVDWLNSKCSPESALGYGKAWAVWPANVAVTTKMPKFWRDAVERNRAKATGIKTPWLILGDGSDKILYEGELPPTVAATQALINTYVAISKRKAG